MPAGTSPRPAAPERAGPPSCRGRSPRPATRGHGEAGPLTGGWVVCRSGGVQQAQQVFRALQPLPRASMGTWAKGDMPLSTEPVPEVAGSGRPENRVRQEAAPTGGRRLPDQFPHDKGLPPRNEHITHERCQVPPPHAARPTVTAEPSTRTPSQQHDAGGACQGTFTGRVACNAQGQAEHGPEAQASMPWKGRPPSRSNQSRPRRCHRIGDSGPSDRSSGPRLVQVASVEHPPCPPAQLRVRRSHCDGCR